MKGMTLGSLFDGIAGFPLAAARHGIKAVWCSEIEPDCMDISARHFPDMQQLGDITKINGAGVTPVDIISFGSPCQNLSVAGNGKGLAGSESRLFFEAVRIINEMRCATNGEYPKYAIWENVSGAFSSNKGQDFRRVLEEITKTDIPMPDSGRWATAGMVGVRGGSTAWRQMDAQFWGVPQRRKRIYLVHDFRGRRAGEILFERKSMLGDTAEGAGEGQGDTGNVENSAAGTHSGGMAAEPDGQMKFNFGAEGGTGYVLPDMYTVIGNVIGRTGKSGGNQLGIGNDGIAPTLTESDRHAVCAPKGIGFRSTSFAGYREDRVSGTLTLGQNKVRGGTHLVVQERKSFNLAGFGKYIEGVGPLRANGGNNGGGSENLITEEKKKSGVLKYIVRRLTPLECERLQGFPDGWTQYGANGGEISDYARYKALGNSIAVPCAEHVFIGILAVEQGKGGIAEKLYMSESDTLKGEPEP